MCCSQQNSTTVGSATREVAASRLHTWGPSYLTDRSDTGSSFPELTPALRGAEELARPPAAVQVYWQASGVVRSAGSAFQSSWKKQRSPRERVPSHPSKEAGYPPGTGKSRRRTQIPKALALHSAQVQRLPPSCHPAWSWRQLGGSQTPDRLHLCMASPLHCGSSPEHPVCRQRALSHTALPQALQQGQKILPAALVTEGGGGQEHGVLPAPGERTPLLLLQGWTGRRPAQPHPAPQLENCPPPRPLPSL